MKNSLILYERNVRRIIDWGGYLVIRSNPDEKSSGGKYKEIQMDHEYVTPV